MPNEGTWLDLLLTDAPLEAFEERRRALAEAACGVAEQNDVERGAGAALRLKALLIQHEKRAAEFAALNDIAGRLTTLHDRHHLLREVVVQAQRLLDVDLAYLALIDGDGQHMWIEVASGSFTPQLLGLRLSLRSGLVGHVITKGIPLWTSDYAAETSFEHAPEADAAAHAEHIHSLLAVPLTVRGSTIGALLASERQERQFRTEEITLLTALAAHAAIAIENARLLSGYEHNLQRLNDVNRELGTRTEELQRSIQWQQSLTQVVLRGGGVPELLHEVASLFSGDIWFNTDRTDIGLADDVEPSLLDAALGEATNSDEQPACVMVDTRDGHACLVGVRAGEKWLGWLVLRTRECPSHAERVLLESTAPALALSLMAEQAVAEATSRAQGAFLDDLLINPSMDKRIQLRQAKLAGIDLSASYSVMAFSGDARQSGSLRKAVGEIAHRHGCRVAERADEFIVVIPSRGVDEFAANWSAMPIPMRPTCGIAGPAKGVEALAQALVQARRVVAALLVLDRAGDTATAEDLGIYRVLLTPFGRAEVRTMTDTILGALTGEAKRTGVPLERTLEVFFDEGRKYSRAAAALRIHVNTLYQRLDTVKQVLGEDWQKPNRAFELHTALRLRRLAARLDQCEGVVSGVTTTHDPL